MSERTNPAARPAMAGSILGGAVPAAGDEALDKALQALEGYDWGQDPGVVKAIDTALQASHGNPGARKDLERRLAAILRSDSPRAAKKLACDRLSRIGTADSVPALAALLEDRTCSHMARYALERISSPEAAKALRDVLPNLKGELKVGVINSLGVRRDPDSVSPLAALLGDSAPEIAGAAAAALGRIGTPEAARALGAFLEKAPEGPRGDAADGCLACAEQLLAGGRRDEAAAIYKILGSGEHPEHVRLAARRGLSIASGKE